MLVCFDIWITMQTSLVSSSRSSCISLLSTGLKMPCYNIWFLPGFMEHPQNSTWSAEGKRVKRGNQDMWIHNNTNTHMQMSWSTVRVKNQVSCTECLGDLEEGGFCDLEHLRTLSQGEQAASRGVEEGWDLAECGGWDMVHLREGRTMCGAHTYLERVASLTLRKQAGRRRIGRQSCKETKGKVVWNLKCTVRCLDSKTICTFKIKRG